MYSLDPGHLQGLEANINQRCTDHCKWRLYVREAHCVLHMEIVSPGNYCASLLLKNLRSVSVTY